MTKYIPDINTKRWVIISKSRAARPEDNTNPTLCPFCPGHESETPPELYRIGPGEKDKPGWQVRVIPNKYPITDMHEVIIHGPSCDDNIEKLSPEHINQIIKVYRDRYIVHKSDGQVIIFCNHGAHAGASLKHPHSQLVVVPKQINLDALSREPNDNVIDQNPHFVAYCPDFSQWPFETWITPNEKNMTFADITDEAIQNLAILLKTTLKRLMMVYEDRRYSFIHSGIQFGYNYYISSQSDWFIRVIPRFVHRAGFELGTGLSVNPVDPEEAAQILKSYFLK